MLYCLSAYVRLYMILANICCLIISVVTAKFYIEIGVRLDLQGLLKGHCGNSKKSCVTTSTLAIDKVLYFSTDLDIVEMRDCASCIGALRLARKLHRSGPSEANILVKQVVPSGISQPWASSCITWLSLVYVE